jgi:hypothetical protein
MFTSPLVRPIRTRRPKEEHPDGSENIEPNSLVAPCEHPDYQMAAILKRPGNPLIMR